MRLSGVLFMAALLALAPGGSAAAAPERPLVLVPGILGSRLCRGTGNDEVVVWGTISALRQVASLRLGAVPDGIHPCGLVREISVLGPLRQDYYGPIVARLEEAGYREGESLFVFDYDWRQSVFDNAARLADFVRVTLPADVPFDILAHSMGGLVSRVYLLEEGGAARVKRFIAAGTPWWGSVKLFELIEQGYGPITPLLGGIETVRRTILSFPSIYELAPRYTDCCASVTGGFDPAEPASWPALGWDGVALDAMPDLELLRTRRARLAEIVDTPLPEAVDEAVAIGVDQRTAESFRLLRDRDTWAIEAKVSWSGDGVVVPASSGAGERMVYKTSFSVHHAILSDPFVQDFAISALRNGPEQALIFVPVRARDRMRTTLGRLATLIGVAVVTDDPAYATGDEVQVRVILRLDDLEPVDPASVVLQAEHPNGATVIVPLSRDPVGTDNPFEQVFKGRVGAGPLSGTLRLRSELDVEGNQSRVAEAAVPVITP